MLNIHALMKELAQKEPVFHSEADFKLELFRLMREKYPHAQVRLEYPFIVSSKNIHLDIWIDAGEYYYAVELKYKTYKLERDYSGEFFHLKTQGAVDRGRYEFLKDVSRLESVTDLSSKPCIGYAVLLANDSSYWSTPQQKHTNSKEFEIYHNRQISGLLSWTSESAEGERIVLENESISLNNSYSIHWQEYSNISQTSSDQFRYVAIEIK